MLPIHFQLFRKEEFPGSTNTACTKTVCTHCVRIQGAWRHTWGTKRRCSAQPECAPPDSKTLVLNTRAMQNVHIHKECLCVQNWVTHTRTHRTHTQAVHAHPTGHIHAECTHPYTLHTVCTHPSAHMHAHSIPQCFMPCRMNLL